MIEKAFYRDGALAKTTNTQAKTIDKPMKKQAKPIDKSMNDARGVLLKAMGPDSAGDPFKEEVL